MSRHTTRSFVLLLVGACAALSAEAQIKARINTDRVSARAKASIFSEVVAQLRQGDEVTVLEVIKHQNPRQGEPAEWVKIKMPSDALLWVNTAHVDSGKKTVSATRLNVRAGPGLNFSIVGSLNQGDVIRPVRVLDEWVEIEAPSNSWAYVNSLYLIWGKPRQVRESSGSNGLSGSNGMSEAPVSKTAETQLPASRQTPSAQNASGPAVTAVRLPPSSSASSGAVQALPTEFSSANLKSALADGGEQSAAPKLSQKGTISSLGGTGAGSGAGNTGEARKTELAAGQTVQRVEAGSGKRPVRREGVLTRSMMSRMPSPYRLKSIDTGRVIGIVRFGNEIGEIGRFVGRRVVIAGIESSNKASPEIPVIDAEEIALVEQ